MSPTRHSRAVARWLAPTRLLGAGLLGACLALAGGVAPVAAEQFVDWSVTCPSGPDALCIMETPALNSEEPDAVLRMTRTTGGEVRQISLAATPLPVLTRRFPLLLRVDSRKPVRLTQGHGIEASDLGTLRIFGSSEIDKLLRQMGPGRRIRLEFYDQDKDYRFAVFSLDGLGKALGATPSAGGSAPEAGRAAEPAQDAAGAETPPARPQRQQASSLRPPPTETGGPLVVSGDDLPEGTVFTPLGELPPRGDCFEHRRSIDRSGRFLGWVSTDLCR